MTEQQAEHAHNREGEAAEQESVVWVEEVWTSVCLYGDVLAGLLSK
jgi:hypothetical protein